MPTPKFEISDASREKFRRDYTPLVKFTPQLLGALVPVVNTDWGLSITDTNRADYQRIVAANGVVEDVVDRALAVLLFLQRQISDPAVTLSEVEQGVKEFVTKLDLEWQEQLASSIAQLVIPNEKYRHRLVLEPFSGAADRLQSLSYAIDTRAAFKDGKVVGYFPVAHLQMGHGKSDDTKDTLILEMTAGELETMLKRLQTMRDRMADVSKQMSSLPGFDALSDPR